MRTLDQVFYLHYRSKDAYDELAAVLCLPEQVRGYGEIRYPTMIEPLKRIEGLLNKSAPREATASPGAERAIGTAEQVVSCPPPKADIRP